MLPPIHLMAVVAAVSCCAGAQSIVGPVSTAATVAAQGAEYTKETHAY